MQPANSDLLAAALGLAYKYCGLPALRRGFAKVEAAANGLELTQALSEAGDLTDSRADKLKRGALLAERLRYDAIYGMIALRNRLVGGQMLNACMEESRRSGYEKSLSEVLIDRGVLTDSLHAAIVNMQSELSKDLFGKERALAAAIDLKQDDDETVELTLAVLLGEVSAKLSFLNREEFDAALRAQEQIAQGVAPEVATKAAPVANTSASHPAIKVAAPDTSAEAKTSAADDAIKGYELLDKLGAGAMGAVLKARKRDTGEIVALKILKPELSADREYVERFLREAKAVARLGHEHIIRAVQVGKSGDYYFFAMEFVEGQTASEIIKSQGSIPEVKAIGIVRAIAGALAHAWQHQIVHRDIKPDNIMIGAGDVIKLTDLGLARTTKQDSTLTITGVVMGSPAYISPEQATGERNLDVRSDLYSLGATLFHMLTGVVPYDGDTPLHVMLKHMNDPVPDVKKVLPTVSDATRFLLLRMMAKKPAGRFQKASQVEQVARGIEAALKQGQVPAVPAGLAPKKKAPRPQPSTTAAAPGGTPRKSRRPSMRSSESGEARKMRTSQSGEKKAKASPQKSKQKEVGERLRRMKKKRRF